MLQHRAGKHHGRRGSVASRLLDVRTDVQDRSPHPVFKRTGVADVLDDIGTVLREHRVGQRRVVVKTSEHAVRTIMILELGENLINDSPHVLADSFALDDVDNPLIAVKDHPLGRRHFGSCHFCLIPFKMSSPDPCSTGFESFFISSARLDAMAWTLSSISSNVATSIAMRSLYPRPKF